MRRLVGLAGLAVALLLLLACDEHKVDRVGGPGTTSSSSAASSSPPASEAQRTRSIEDRARAIGERARQAQENATTDQEKEDAVNRTLKDTQQLANDAQSGQPADQGSPPPNVP